ncbi:A disintegrin and metalloproteinase with thrombospondin motifs 7 isoform X2 [Lingula anatina]|uniref:A disintegrin and metalloproteinase with thrombospondin motifs 7 isoform X1 n=1 Tax=Lingula anatina TaxID=7574 RepID=A0A1S3J871_LINAN|nr:A disintegrin and metalloproteinase with thrombospondin motifs 7 isoform X1 [Lingula anatina]XP_013406431.1 A disintegrin and metalloproteinase with thrombospondin motifs 7 isoform X2 [Lingula anatina]|eukprot:XP_013406430.1 A disintegrin and metalloproteinase with thrombospondin motifs 7 isoform X1 [Lingula anatina]
MRTPPVDCTVHFLLYSLVVLASQFKTLDSHRLTEFSDHRQAEFVSKLDSYEISIPLRVTKEGEFLTHSLHHERFDTSVHKRSIESEEEEQIHYHVQVGEHKLHLQLTPNHKLFAPGMVVERRNGKFGNVSDSKVQRYGFNKCHFIGNIKGHIGSKVAVATCQGLTGLLWTDHGEYFIEPVKGHNTTKDPKHPHILYKRSALLPELGGYHADHSHHGDSTEGYCGVQEEEKDVAEKQRERWEEHENKKNHKRRQKRSYSLERNVEILVVVDPKMMEYYKNDQIDTYVLTIMNMVAIMYHDASIGNAVNLVIVRMLLLKKDEEGLKINNHADNSLKSFCKWQNSMNPKDDSHPNHHDVAVLLTRYNICSRLNEPCSTLGLAEVTGLCQPHRSCNINEDTGLALAYTVAHELGHNFGMKHDTEKNGCEAVPGAHQHVMAPQLTADNKPLIWSNCSRTSITRFLDRNWGYCLEDEPADHKFAQTNLPPGVMYDADHQCRLQYGPEASHCKGIENVCSILWCRIDNRCLTRLETAAEGTRCKENITGYLAESDSEMWCFNGECTVMGERPEAIDGNWGMWSGWTGCSRSCGAGVKYSERHCDNPPPSNGGKYCLGERKRYRICNTKSCPEGEPDFLESQCAEFNYIPYKNGLYEWEPVPSPLNPCQLHCKPVNKFFSVMLRDIVKDGTPCKLGTRNMCISGRCRHIGCDWVIDSEAKEDRCGVCHGDGRACTTVKKEFKDVQGLGYVEATVIPEGARNIRVEEVAEANNYLAIKDKKGDYLLNGHWYIQWSGDYKVAGTTLRYDRVGNKESFSAAGPIKEPLHIMLLFQSINPGVVFEYTVPNENATEREPVFLWEFTDWTHCTASCGGGFQRRVVVCTEVEAGVVDDEYCNMTSRPEDKQKSCNEHLCPARWWAGPWGHCSVTCGDNGMHRRTVICVRSLGQDQQIALEDQDCEDQVKPEETGPCHHKDSCPVKVEWQVGPWSACTRKCGLGIQFRQVECMSGHKCNHLPRPKTQQVCSNIPCPTDISNVVPELENIGDSSQKDNSSLKTNLVDSVQSRNNDSNTDQTIVTSSPTTVASFSTTAKTDDLNNKQQSGINPSDKDYKVLSPFSSNSKADLDDGAVDTPSNQELTEKQHPINQRHRHHHGHRNRTHSSKNIRNNAGDKEDEEISLGSEDGRNEVLVTATQMQLYKWRPLEWSACSKECGGGVRTRPMKCVNQVTKTVSWDTMCHDGDKPSEVEACNDEPCLEWEVSDWGECSVSCGPGVQARSVRCPEKHRCDHSIKPAIHQHCNQKSCLLWVTGPWSSCSKSCGTGEQIRHVKCINTSSDEPVDGCDSSIKPVDKQQCNTDGCSDENAAFEEGDCRIDKMRSTTCEVLKGKGLCDQRFVARHCCVTCKDDKTDDT